ncbi:hypothetical protein LB526_01960 [Mesorhizobium sp. CA6]|uniref:hypothetical protein n=1 Tax=Mesorhizobium sp. CA6 TaxID=588500 RepID=UPI001CCAE53A|nr:hypothetical protein [Mesorhizobium sp. CA6]MBZ9765525.1 hypothetical protein [Mesorhizobium sp. CA6]
MALVKKTLWVVDIKTEAAEKMFAKHALAVSATAVCIRTSRSRLQGAIDRFHKIGMEVYGWRWPSALPSATLAEANKVAQNLIPAGLDGYIVDPEGSNDWNNPKTDLGPLATQFCDTIRKAAGKNFVFGTASGCAYPSLGGKPHIPFEVFFAASDVLLPQTYWRWTHFDPNKLGVTDGHFYTDNGRIPVTVLAAIKSL